MATSYFTSAMGQIPCSTERIASLQYVPFRLLEVYCLCKISDKLQLLVRVSRLRVRVRICVRVTMGR